MFRSILQSAGAVLLGLIIAFGLVAGVEGFSNAYHPFPPDVDPTDFAVCSAHVARYPAWLLAVCGLFWSITAFVSTWTATRLGPGRHPAHGYGLGGFLLGMAVFNIVILPYPIWFKVFTPIALALSVYWGQKRARGCKTNESCSLG
ncbi:MAG: hypothetical protein EXS11_01400 [Gemmataceae bacterium]|nr:hypothetical protein [Gemmataceae bacterium]